MYKVMSQGKSTIRSIKNSRVNQHVGTLGVAIVQLAIVADVTATICTSYYSTYGYKYCIYSCCGSSCCSSYDDSYNPVSAAYSAASVTVIVGAVIGGLIGLALLISLIICVCCMINKRKSTGRVIRGATGANPGVAVVSNAQYSQTQYGQPMPMNTYHPAQTLPEQAMYPPPHNPAYPSAKPPAYTEVAPETSPFNQGPQAPPFDQATAYGNPNSFTT